MGLFTNVIGEHGVRVDGFKIEGLTQEEKFACKDIAGHFLKHKEIKNEERINVIRQIWPSEPVNLSEVLAKLEIFFRFAVALAQFQAQIWDVNKVKKLIDKAFACEGEISHYGRSDSIQDIEPLAERGTALLAGGMIRAEELLTREIKSGKSIVEAITIDAKNEDEGIYKEHEYLVSNFGDCGIDWEPGTQSLMEVDGKRYDEISLHFPDGSSKKIYFDITSWYGKL